MSADDRPASRTIASLGKPLYQQKPTIANQIAGLIIAVLMAIGGGVLCWLPVREYRKFGGRLPVFHERDMSWVTAAAMCTLGIGIIVGGIILWRRIWSMFSFCLFVCPDGFYYKLKGETIVFGWDEIRLVEETVLHERLPLVKGAARRLMPTKTSRAYRVVRCDGKEFNFDGDTLSRVSLLAGPLARYRAGSS
ncbi:MAG TPA: hypothetical protein VFI31_13480 [Pirellulales bacterium]|nr:hypothetical protein [Pirellulales bacterium]